MKSTRTLTIDQLVNSIRCDCIVLGPSETVISGVAPIDLAEEGDLAFCAFNGEQGIAKVRTSNSRTIITFFENEGFRDLFPDKTLILVRNPRLAFVRAMKEIFIQNEEPSIHPSAIISPDAIIGARCSIGPNVYIGRGVTLGNDVTIEPNVVILDGVFIGNNVIIHSNANIGMDGFSHIRNDDGHLEKFPQLGRVLIHDDVEIGSNTCIAKATMAETVVGRGTRIDNLVHIAHNVRIGEDCFIVAGAVICGSVVIGDRCWIAPKSCIRDCISVGNDVTVGMGSVVTKSIPDGQIVMGVPARPLSAVKKEGITK